MTTQNARCCVFSQQEIIDNRTLIRDSLWIVVLPPGAGADTNTVRRNGETTLLSQCVHIFAKHS